MTRATLSHARKVRRRDRLELCVQHFTTTQLDLGAFTKTDTYPTVELITNGTFAVDISGWTDASVGDGVTAWNAGGWMDLTTSGAGYAGRRQSIVTIAGLSYRLTFVDGVGVLNYIIGTAAGGSQIASGAALVGANTIDFVAQSATTWLEFGHSATATYTLDTVSVLPTQGLIGTGANGLTVAGGTGAWGTTRVVDTAHPISRVAGQTILWRVTPGATNKDSLVGLGRTATPTLADGVNWWLRSTGVLTAASYDGESVAAALPISYPTAECYVSLTLGTSGSAGALWKYGLTLETMVPVWVTYLGTTAILYDNYQSYNAPFTSRAVRHYRGPAPLPALSGSPAATVPSLGASDILNGGYDSDTANWSSHNTGTLSSEGGGQAGNCLQVLNGAANNGGAYQQIVTTAGQWRRLAFYHKNGLATGFLRLETAAGLANIYTPAAYNDADWAAKTVYYRAAGAATVVRFAVGTSTLNDTTLFDTVSDQSITPASQLSGTTNLGRKQGVFELPVTVPVGSAGGFVIGLDDEANPQNYVRVFTNRTNLTVDKCISGTETRGIIDTATGVTYADARKIRLVVYGNSVAAYYESAANVFTQIGTTQTVVMNTMGTKVAAWSPDSAVTFGAWGVYT